MRSAPGRFDAALVSWLIQQAPQGIIVTDSDLVVRDWNVWLEFHSGLTRAEVEGRLLVDLFPDLVDRDLYVFYHDALNGQSRLLSHRFHRYLIPLPSSAESEFDRMQQTAEIVPLMDDQVVIGTLTIINDVTERVVRERELRRAQKVAEAANESKDRFVAMLSHDLRVPINSVIGWLRVIDAKRDKPDILATGLKSIENSTLTQLRMIEDLLDVARISAGKLTLDLADTDVGKVVDDACNLLRPLADSNAIRLASVTPVDRTILRADAKRLQQVVWNLVSNALKFTPQHGKVGVELQALPKGIRLSVSDTGIGMNRDVLEHVFERMWQSEAGSGAQSGLGLGLSIVRKIVELHGGSVRAESAGPGMGSTFIIDLPFSTTSTETSSS